VLELIVTPSIEIQCGAEAPLLPWLLELGDEEEEDSYIVVVVVVAARNTKGSRMRGIDEGEEVEEEQTEEVEEPSVTIEEPTPIKPRKKAPEPEPVKEQILLPDLEVFSEYQIFSVQEPLPKIDTFTDSESDQANSVLGNRSDEGRG
jgi:hypothetical protein